ncbi:MAG: tetratricopeptide repeat protein [Deltaproteobacteria bacterium]|nr:tetratricopeptide repeat protein [Deltaproteobacteria bacterium]
MKEILPRLCLFLYLLLLFFLFFPESDAVARKIVLDSDDQFYFALQAMEKGEYTRAVTEFERFIHFFPDDQKVPRARYLIGLCYIGAKKYSLAREVLVGVYDDYGSDELGGRALLLVGETYYLQGILGEAEHYFRRVIEGYPSPELRYSAYYRLGWVRLKSDRWTEAAKAFEMVGEDSPLCPSAGQLAEAGPKGEALPRKSPTQAGILAAILPGLGHAYCNRYKDGLVAFLLNGLFIWASVEAFNEDLDVAGGILLALELGWYSGNIYSAVNSAHKYNRKVRDDFRRNLKDKFRFSLMRTSNGSFGLGFSYRF